VSSTENKGVPDRYRYFVMHIVPLFLGKSRGDKMFCFVYTAVLKIGIPTFPDRRYSSKTSKSALQSSESRSRQVILMPIRLRRMVDE